MLFLKKCFDESFADQSVNQLIIFTMSQLINPDMDNAYNCCIFRGVPGMFKAI